MQKFGRAYSLQVGLQNGSTLTIQLPFTVEFDITRNTLTSANVCSIRIYNLSANHRNQIRFDPMNQGQFRPIVFQAGYGSNLTTIFAGNITQAWSEREGTNQITTIECFDGGYAFVNAISNIAFPAGTTYATIIKTLAGSLPNTTLGAIGSYPGSIGRGNSVSGNTMDLLRDMTGGGVFIDNGRVNCLGDNECISNPGIPIINSAAGLLGTPRREQTILTFDMIFEPQIVVGQQIQLVSSAGGNQSVAVQGQLLSGTNPANANFNGFYKVTSVKHRGMISGSVCGDAITSLQMWWGTQTLTPVSA